MGAATLNATIGVCGNEYFLYDCDTADNHYKFQHICYNGTTTVSTAIYANDGATYDVAGDKNSWIVAGNANTSRANPYVSPWITKYNEATSAVTPYLEVLRDGSTTAYKDTEVWAEFSVKTTSGYTIATIDRTDFGGHISAGTNQTTGGATWTGATTPWMGKLSPSGTLTPAEIGHIQARVSVAGNFTVYVDPQIRGT